MLCRMGGCVLRRDGAGPIGVSLVRSAVELIESVGLDGLLLVDVPIGLPEGRSGTSALPLSGTSLPGAARFLSLGVFAI